MCDLGIADDLEVFDWQVAVAGCTVVDAGCGAGLFSRHLLSRGASVIALEPDPVQAAAHATDLALEPGVRFVPTGAEAMPCEDGSVDGVVFSKSLHHIPADLMDRALGEALRDDLLFRPAVALGWAVAVTQLELCSSDSRPA